MLAIPALTPLMLLPETLAMAELVDVKIKLYQP